MSLGTSHDRLAATPDHTGRTMKEPKVDQEAIKNAEAQVATVQAALDDAQRVLQAAERAQQAAEKSAQVMRTVALAALGGLVVVAVAVSLGRSRH